MTEGQSRDFRAQLGEIKRQRRDIGRRLELILAQSFWISGMAKSNRATKSELREALGNADQFVRSLGDFLKSERAVCDWLIEALARNNRKTADAVHEELLRLSSLPIDRPEDNRSVYFAQSSTGHIKIGVSADPRGRVKAIDASTPLAVKLLATEPGGEAQEKRLHRRFMRHRHKREWFEPAPEIMAHICSLRSRSRTRGSRG